MKNSGQKIFGKPHPLSELVKYGGGNVGVVGVQEEGRGKMFALI